MSTTQRSKSRLVAVLCITALFSLVGIGCSDDDIPGVDTSVYYGLGTDPSPVPFTISLEGTTFDAATSGQTLGGGAEVALEGFVTPAGATAIAVEGGISGGSVSFSGGAWSFVGTVSGNTIQGAAFTPNGTGSFALFIGGAPANVTLYCGSGDCTLGCTGSANANVAVAGSTAILTAYLDGGAVVGAGTVTGSSVEFNLSSGSNSAVVDGTISGTDITNGSWSTDDSDPLNNPDPSGVWSASTGQCTSVPTLRR